MTVIYQAIQPILGQNESDWEREVNHGIGLATKSSEPELKPPPLYRVIILNDDYTPMDFVVNVLERFFSMTNESATRVMLQVHTEGKGICGVYPKDIAETKAARVNEYARQNDHPLLCEVECQD